MKSKDLGNLCIWGDPGQGCHLLTMPKYLFFTDLILKTISSLTSDLEVVQFSVSRGSGTLKLCQNNFCLLFNIIKNS